MALKTRPAPAGTDTSVSDIANTDLTSTELDFIMRLSDDFKGFAFTDFLSWIGARITEVASATDLTNVEKTRLPAFVKVTTAFSTYNVGDILVYDHQSSGWKVLVAASSGGGTTLTKGDSLPASPATGQFHILTKQTTANVITATRSVTGETDAQQYASNRTTRAYYNPASNSLQIFMGLTSAEDETPWKDLQTGDHALFFPASGSTKDGTLTANAGYTESSHSLSFTVSGFSAFADGVQYTAAAYNLNAVIPANTILYYDGTYWYVVLKAVSDSGTDRYKGAWAASTNYTVGDQVLYNNHIYLCKTANSDATFTASKWFNLSSDTDTDRYKGAWVASTSYALGDQVLQNGIIYLCKTANSDATFTASNWFDLSSDADTNIYKGTWTANVSYVLGELVVHSNNIYLCKTANSDATFTATHWYNLTESGNLLNFYDSGATADNTHRTVQDTDAIQGPDLNEAGVIETEDISGFGRVYKTPATKFMRINYTMNATLGVAFQVRYSTTKPTGSSDAKTYGTQCSQGNANTATECLEFDAAANTYWWFALSGGTSRIVNKRDVRIRIGYEAKAASKGGRTDAWLTSAAFVNGDLADTGTLNFTVASDAPTGVADGANTKFSLPWKPPGTVFGWEIGLYDSSDNLVSVVSSMWPGSSSTIVHYLKLDSTSYVSFTVTDVGTDTLTLTFTVSAENTDNGLTGYTLQVKGLEF